MYCDVLWCTLRAAGAYLVVPGIWTTWVRSFAGAINGWELGVPPWLGKPPNMAMVQYGCVSMVGLKGKLPLKHVESMAFLALQKVFSCRRSQQESSQSDCVPKEMNTFRSSCQSGTQFSACHAENIVFILLYLKKWLVQPPFLVFQQ